MDIEIVKRRIEELRPWRHDIDLGNGLRTGSGNYPSLDPGGKWELFEKYLPKDMSGSSVLDVGSNTGYIAIQCKLRGADRVVTVDNYKKNVKQVEFLSEFFNVVLEIKRQDAHIYTLTTDERFDYVIFSRVFYHLRYPTLVLDRLAEMTKKRMIFLSETVGPEDLAIPKENIDDKNDFSKPEYPKMFFIEKKFARDITNWWIPNESCCDALIRSADLKIVSHPKKGVFICEPYQYRKTYEKATKLFFPGYDELRKEL